MIIQLYHIYIYNRERDRYIVTCTGRKRESKRETCTCHTHGSKADSVRSPGGQRLALVVINN